MNVVKQGSGINHVTLLRALKQPCKVVGNTQPGLAFSDVI